MPVLFSGIHIKNCNITPKKDIPSVSVSPYHFKMVEKNEYMENNGLEVVSNQENHKRRDALGKISSNSEMGISDWSMHEKIVADLSSGPSHDGAEKTTIKNGETHSKVGHKNGLSSLLHVWCLAQLDTFVTNSAEDVSSLVIGSKILLHLRVKIHKLPRHGKIQISGYKFPRNRNQVEEPLVDVLYMLSLSEESLHENIIAYELAFEKGSRDNCSSRSLDVLLGKLQLGDILFSRVAYETPPENVLSTTISSLDWMGTAPLDVNHSRYSLT